MTRAPFIVTHDGVSIRCELTVDDKAQVRNMGVLAGQMIASAKPSDPHVMEVALRVSERMALLNDLLHAGVEFGLLATCRHAPGVNGSIIDPACWALEELQTSPSGKKGHAA